MLLVSPACEDVYMQIHKGHGCNCAKFNIDYEIYGIGGGSNGKRNFGVIDVNNGDPGEPSDKYDEDVGRKVVIESGTCFEKIKITCDCRIFPTGAEDDPCKGFASGGNNSCHDDGLSAVFTNAAGDIFGEMGSITTNTPQEISYCQIFSGIGSAF